MAFLKCYQQVNRHLLLILVLSRQRQADLWKSEADLLSYQQAERADASESNFWRWASLSLKHLTSIVLGLWSHLRWQRGWR